MMHVDSCEGNRQQWCLANRRHSPICEPSRNVRQAPTCPCYVLANKSDRAGSCHQQRYNQLGPSGKTDSGGGGGGSVSSLQTKDKVYASIHLVMLIIIAQKQNEVAYCFDALIQCF